jgi:serine/threonine protein kinase
MKCFLYVDLQHQLNVSFISKLVKNNYKILQFVSESLKNLKSFGLTCVSIAGESLEYLSISLRDDEEIVKAAVENNPECFIFASKRIQYLGKTLKYKTIKKINEGGEGLIYLVQKNEELFAEKRIIIEDLKTLNGMLIGLSNLISLENENLYEIKEIIQDQNEITNATLIRIVMKLYHGDLLTFTQENFKETSIPELLIVHFGIQILNGLVFLHEHSIIHGDLKIENIFYEMEGNEIQLKIGDFGFNEMKSFEIYGSLMNIAPEIILQESKHNEKSDMFSFGGILYRLMKGKDEILYLESLNGTLSLEKENYSKELKSLVLGLLDSDPLKRKNGKEMLKELILLNKNYL